MEIKNIVRKLFQNVDLTIQERGLKKTIDNLIETSKTKIDTNIRYVNNIDYINYVLRYESLLIIANHENYLEILPLIAVLPERNDIHIIAASEFLELGTNLSRQILPIYSSNTSKRHVNLFIRLGKYFFRSSINNCNLVHKLNIASLNKAVSLLKSGAVIILFPSGVNISKGKWESGIGFILRSLKDFEKDIFYLKMYVRGASIFDFLRLIKGIGCLFPSIRVNISEPQKIKTIVRANDSSKKISSKLEKEFNNWVNFITNS